MPTLNYGASLSGSGTNINQSVPRTADGAGQHEVSLPVSQAGTLTTRTDDDTGTITMGSGSHGIATGQVVDIFWSTGVRYGVTVGTVSGTSVPFGAPGGEGAGDVLPAQDTNVVVSARVQVNSAIDGDQLQILGMQMQRTNNSSTATAHASFQESDNTSIAEVDFVGSVPQILDIAGGATNIFTGDPIAKVMISNGSSTETATFKLAWVADSTP